MPRRRLILTEKFPYHVTSRANNKENFYVSLDLVWKVFCEELSQVHIKYEVLVYSLVLMSNHFHLILLTPQANVGDVMRDLLTNVSKAIQKQANRTNHVFGKRYTWGILPNAASIAYTTKYLFRNPIRARLCRSANQYQYSSLNNPLAPTVSGLGDLWRFVPRDRTDMLSWLNTPTAHENEEQIRLALRKPYFRFSRSNKSNKSVRNLISTYGVENSTATFGAPRETDTF